MTREPTLLLGIAVVLVAGMYIAGNAHADVVMPPPTDCTKGSVGATGHGGPYCRADLCTRGCDKGTTCQPTQLCVVKKEAWSRAGKHFVDDVTGACSGTGICATGTCTTLDVCMPPQSRAGIKCGCRTGPGESVPWGWLLVVPGLLALRRRARARVIEV
jgi:MYXO-CTERM domain-containing protein